jgi:maleylacetoacetate isomerase
MQLYSFFNSSTSYRVRIALAIKGQTYDTQGVNLRSGQQRDAAYLEVNPSGVVPSLVDDEVTLSQSLAIIDYLDARFPEPRLIPADPVQRARVLEVSNAIACDIHPVNNLRILRYLKDQFNVDEDGRNAWYRHWVAEGLSGVNALLERHGDGPYCFGDAPTLADCCLVPQVANALRMKCDLSPYACVMAIYTHASAQPAFVAAEPARQPDYIA